MTTTTTTRYEHRTITEHNAGPHYGGDMIIPAGIILKKTKTAGKFTYYNYVHTMHYVYEVPAEKVGVFKITRTVTETEEAL